MAVPPLLTLLPLLLLLLLAAAATVRGATIDPGDLSVLEDLRGALTNPDALGWGAPGTDPCGGGGGGGGWAHVSCDRSGRVNNLDLKNAGLAGTLPPSFPKLTALQDLSLQNNSLAGPLPSFRGMAALRAAYLNGNAFTAIPRDFFDGLGDLEEFALDGSPLNASDGGWAVPPGLAAAAPQLRKLWLQNCNLVGALPDSLGALTGLQELRLSYNSLSGPIPPSFATSGIQTLWLNNQRGDQKLSGTLDVLAGMVHLQEAWLHGNQFSGPIPTAIAACKQLAMLYLNGNNLVGVVPMALTALPRLNDVKLDDNHFLGPAPAFRTPNASFSHNGFCSDDPGVACAPEVSALLRFLAEVGYPVRLAWAGNDPCKDWLGVTCDQGKVTVLNLPGYGLNGTISSSLGNLSTLSDIRLHDNNLTGHVPDSLTNLKSLKKLDLSTNNLIGPLPAFSQDVVVSITGNPNFNGTAPPGGDAPQSPTPSAPARSQGQAATPGNNKNNNKRSVLVLAITIPVAVSVVALLSLGAVVLFCKKNGSVQPQATSSVVVHPRDSSGPDNLVKIVMASNDSFGGTSSGTSSQDSDIHMIEARNFVISVQVLRSATKNFSQDNVLGRGGFGVVYKGVLHDGTMIAVKRMESSVISNKALDEFQAEIAILTKVRHRNLVSILGYSIEGNERLLVYEHMSNGALSKHLFQWKLHDLEPLSWKKRLNIALDVARGMEYLHTLAQQCYIHRDLKPANILLGDDFRAKVSDFGLLKSAPDGNFSVATRLAGTFGYLAPEYAVTGKITTKADVFSFGVVLMELITGMTAIDERRLDEETRYLATWFCQIRKDEEKLRAAIDPTLVLTEEILESISVIAELAGHCTSREPLQRPDMGHAVTVLVPMVEKWKPSSNEAEDYMGIDLHLPLLQMVKGWQESEANTTTDGSILSLEDSKGSIPARPAGFAESFTSADGR